ncbi:hypothetical protein Q1695_015983 [Nippostrongylus brasiliensis]|nr:hypothetical protein Q1695_015983 [Nippostrongylus brasiliensis]
MVVLALIISLAALFLPVLSDDCPPKCSPHITLPCSFPSLDRCMERKCREICRNDGQRNMIGCFCRGSLEGAASRSCFCGPSRNRQSGNVTIIF